jgi:hypothetical protein
MVRGLLALLFLALLLVFPAEVDEDAAEANLELWLLLALEASVDARRVG